MFMNMIGDRMTRPKRRRQNKRDLVLPGHITGAISHTGFRSAVGQRLKTERALIKVRRLLAFFCSNLMGTLSLVRQEFILNLRGALLCCASNGLWLMALQT